MRDAVASVLSGEYESGCSGEGLRILDIGANVGAFCIWADGRWPGSSIHAFEPHPATFAILARNLAGRHNVTLHNAAVYPGSAARAAFTSRYDGDGEAGLMDCMARTFASLPPERTLMVDVVPPRGLPAADVVKLDVEGAEGAIVAAMDLTSVSLVLVEYQDLANRTAVIESLGQRFELIHETSAPWDELLPGSDYLPRLAGDRYGTMSFLNRAPGPLHRSGPPGRRRSLRSSIDSMRASAGALLRRLRRRPR